MTVNQPDHLPSIPATYDGNVRAYESSSAEGPCVWLAITERVTDEDAHIELIAENAWHLAEQLMTLVRDHYQGDARPADRVADLIPSTEVTG